MKKYVLFFLMTAVTVTIFFMNNYQQEAYPFPDNTITFEDGFLWTAQCIGDKNFQDDESDCILTVEKFNGSNQLRIQVLDKSDDGNYKVPKIKFDVDMLVGSQNVSRIKSISLDITSAASGNFTADDGSELFVPGNCMGEIDANSGESCAVWTTLAEFDFAEWEEDSASRHITGQFLLPKSRYIDGETGCTIVLMRWPVPNQADIYIDNLAFYDDDGNLVPIVYDPLNPDNEEVTG